MSDHRTYFASGRIAQAHSSIEFPHPTTLVGKDPVRDAELFSRAPWYHPVAFRDTQLVNEYVLADRLPDGVPIQAITTDEWARRFVVPDNALLRKRVTAPDGTARRTTLRQARHEYTRSVFMRMYRTPGEELIDPALGFDTWVYRTHGEAMYGPTLSAVLVQSSDWAGDPRPRQEALSFRRPLLRAEFRFTRLRDNEVFWDLLRWERRIRSRMGYLVPYQMSEILGLRDDAKTTRYVRIPNHYHAFETPRGFFVDLPPVLTYAGREMINDPSSGVWAIFYTEWVAKVAAGLLWECYDNYRLWWIPEGISTYIREMNLSQVLGGKHNYEEVLSLVELIDQTNWCAVSAQNQQRGASASRDLSPGKADGSGDWVWFDPWTRRVINAEEASALRRESRVVPDNHPTGYVYCHTPVVSGLYPDIGLDSDMEEEDDVLEDTPTGEADTAEHVNVVPSLPSEMGSGFTWVNDPRSCPAPNADDASRLAFLRSFLRDAGIDVREDASMAELRQLVSEAHAPSRERVGSSVGASTAPGTNDDAMDATPDCGPPTGSE